MHQQPKQEIDQYNMRLAYDYIIGDVSHVVSRKHPFFAPHSVFQDLLTLLSYSQVENQTTHPQSAVRSSKNKLIEPLQQIRS